MEFLFPSTPRSLAARRFLPRVETLENRLNLAGVITAVLAGQTLTITGDELANEVRIVGTGSGNFSVSGVNGTLLNDLTEGAEDFTGVANLVINLGDENDIATIIAADLAGFLFFNGGTGNDELLFGELAGDSQTFGNVVARMGDGNDAIRIDGNNFAVTQSFTALLGNGDNTTDLDPASLDVGILTVVSGSGTDLTEIGSGTTTTGPLTVYGGTGDNSLLLNGNITVAGALTVAGRDGIDEVVATGTSLDVSGFATLFLGGGNNEVTLNHTSTTVDAALGIITLGGDDQISLGGDTVDLGNLAVATGFGNDTLSLLAATSTTVQGLTGVALGMGNDTLNIENAQFLGITTLLTGTGTDVVNIETASNNGAGTTFAAFTTIELGLGDDTLNMGLDSNDFAAFTTAIIISGGLGGDVFDDSGFNTFAIPPVLISIA